MQSHPQRGSRDEWEIPGNELAYRFNPSFQMLLLGQPKLKPVFDQKQSKYLTYLLAFVLLMVFSMITFQSVTTYQDPQMVFTSYETDLDKRRGNILYYEYQDPTDEDRVFIFQDFPLFSLNDCDTLLETYAGFMPSRNILTRKEDYSQRFIANRTMVQARYSVAPFSTRLLLSRRDNQAYEGCNFFFFESSAHPLLPQHGVRAAYTCFDDDPTPSTPAPNRILEPAPSWPDFLDDDSLIVDATALIFIKEACVDAWKNGYDVEHTLFVKELEVQWTIVFNHFFTYLFLAFKLFLFFVLLLKRFDDGNWTASSPTHTPMQQIAPHEDPTVVHVPSGSL